jgi:hypothetical protein
METLGFSNPSATWTDNPVQHHVADDAPRRGRHEAPEAEPVTVADWVPEEFGTRLTGRNIRWSIIMLSLLVVCGAGGFAYWLYQRPVAQAEASLASLSSEASRLQNALPTLETFGANMTSTDAVNSTELFGVDDAARALFQASGTLSGDAANLRSYAAAASTATLDGVRLAGDANSYRLAVTPILIPPGLETDPNLIELDEAARDFGEWQMRFDEVRTALPDQTMMATTERLDILSGDLPHMLTSYMDALREDDQAGATAVLDGLAERLNSVQNQMTASLEEVQSRVIERIAEAQAALGEVLGN